MKSENETLLIINEAVREIIRDDGVENLSIRKICKKAGFSVGTFYNYYENKADLLYNNLLSADKHIEEYIVPNFSGEESDMLFQIMFGFIQRSCSCGWKVTAEMLSYLYRSPTTCEELFKRPLYIRTYNVIMSGQNRNIFITNISAQELSFQAISFARSLSAEWARLQGSYDILEKSPLYLKRWISCICTAQSGGL
ncbi:MAG: TetR/AcrR family transcriptional regulator [Oscillospiraceae bacterium]